MSRRRFIARASSLALGAAGVAHAQTSATILPSISSELRVALVLPLHDRASSDDEAAASLAMGIELGLVEAARAAVLLRGAISIVARSATVADVAAAIENEHPAIIVCGLNDNDTAELARLCSERRVVLFNTRATSDALRGAQCARYAFHIVASDAMHADARRLAAENPTDASALRTMTWDSRLERFGAAQLNARFAAQFHRPMDSAAWSGWVAVKIAWEASQRARSTDATGMVSYLERESSQFDGQKGVPLSFRRWDHQLRQPLYVDRANANRQSDAPPDMVPAANSGSASSALDVLGTSEAGSACRW